MKFWSKLNLSTRVLIGVAAGVLVGLFFGETVAWMSIAGDVFIGLLQMTVLPYIMVSLIVNIGRLSLESGKKLVLFGAKFLGLLLGLGLIALFILPFSFPKWGSGSFYSNDFIAPEAEFDFVKLYIPTNLFESLSLNVVPAVVLFSIFLGLGIMKLPNKEALLKPLDVFNDGLNQVNKMVVKLTPIGVFAIGAGVVSQLSLSDLSRLQGYLLVYLLAVLLMTFIVLPLLISLFTPFSPREVLRITRPTLITIFATGKIIVVYPQLIENIKTILATQDANTPKAEKEVDVIMPLAYPFPNLGTFMIFVFVPFAAWYTGKEMGYADYPIFLSSTLLSSFVAPITGLPFSLNLMNIPADTFQLFVVSTVLTDRIRVVLGAFHLVTLTLLSVAASNGIMKIKWARIPQTVVVCLAVYAGSVYGLNKILAVGMSGIPTNEQIINNFQLISPSQDAPVLDKTVRNPNWLRKTENILGRIKRRKKLRVGVYLNSRPFSFYNDSNQFVGFGVDLAHRLASDLNVSLEFVPVQEHHIASDLKRDYYDIMMSSFMLSSVYAQQMKLSKPYLPVSLAMVVPKDNNALVTFESASALDTFTIAYFYRKDIADEFVTFFPNAGLYPITDFDSFFVSNDSVRLDALLTTAERAAAWTVKYPSYKLVNPLPVHLTYSLVFPVGNDEVWRQYVNQWIDYRTQDGTFEDIYNQWIQGKEYRPEQVQWSIMKDVLGWGTGEKKNELIEQWDRIKPFE